MAYLYTIHMHTNSFHIQEADLKDHPNTMSLLIIQTHNNSHVLDPRFQPLKYTIDLSHSIGHEEKLENEIDLYPSKFQGPEGL